MASMGKPELLKKIEAGGFPLKEVAVSLSDFFDGNKFVGTIGVNIYPGSPTSEFFYQKLKEIEALPLAHEIVIRVTDVDDPVEWFYSDTVYINCSLKKEQLQQYLDDLKPSEIYEGWMYGKPVILKNRTTPEQTIFSIWWD
jgi:hypothetical protein